MLTAIRHCQRLDGTPGACGEANRAQVLRCQKRRPVCLGQARDGRAVSCTTYRRYVMVQWRMELGKSKLSLEQSRSNTSDWRGVERAHIILDGSGAIYTLALRTTEGILASGHWRHAARNRVKWTWRVEIHCWSWGLQQRTWQLRLEGSGPQARMCRPSEEWAKERIAKTHHPFQERRFSQLHGFLIFNAQLSRARWVVLHGEYVNHLQKLVIKRVLTASMRGADASFLRAFPGGVPVSDELPSVRPDVVVERICCSKIYNFEGLLKKVFPRFFSKM